MQNLQDYISPSHHEEASEHEYEIVEEKFDEQSEEDDYPADDDLEEFHRQPSAPNQKSHLNSNYNENVRSSDDEFQDVDEDEDTNEVYYHNMA